MSTTTARRTSATTASATAIPTSAGTTITTSCETAAIHVSDLEVPLVVQAEVHRNDGEDGVALRFVELSSDARRYLGAAVEQLPVVETAEDEGDKGFIVSEILEVECT